MSKTLRVDMRSGRTGGSSGRSPTRIISLTERRGQLPRRVTQECFIILLKVMRSLGFCTPLSQKPCCESWNGTFASNGTDLLCSSMSCKALTSSTESNIPKNSTAQLSPAQHSPAQPTQHSQRSTAQHSTSQRSTAQPRTAQHAQHKAAQNI